MLVPDRFLVLAVGHGHYEAGTGHVSYHAQMSCELYARSLHVLQVDRMVDMAHSINISELDRKFYAKLHLQTSQWKPSGSSRKEIAPDVLIQTVQLPERREETSRSTGLDRSQSEPNETRRT